MTKTPPYSECVERFIRSKRSDRTKSSYRTGCNIFYEFIGGRWPDGLTNDILTAYRIWLLDKPPAGTWQKDRKTISPQSAKAYLACAVAFLDFLNNEEVLPDGVSFERMRSKLRHVLKDNKTPYPNRKVDKAISTIIVEYDKTQLPPQDTNKNKTDRLIILRNKAILHVVYSTAGRIGEIASLTRGDVGDGRLKESVITGKGEESRTIYFTPLAQKAIRAYVSERDDTDDALFVSHHGGGRLSKSRIWRVIKDISRRYGFRDVHPHDFRHFRASQLVSEGARMEIVQKILGHADISTTQRIYAKVGNPETRDAFNSYSLTPQEALDKSKEG